MSLEFSLAISLKERTLELIPGKPKYVCIVTVDSNGEKVQHSFDDGLNALKYVEKLYRDWTNIIVGMKRDTVQKRKILERKSATNITQ